ncbi:hypothetical protein [Prevotella jejuni]|nr:hypothetical protein [Prevotella jejuni]
MRTITISSPQQPPTGTNEAADNMWTITIGSLQLPYSNSFF